ncbi:MAG: hypothetical protein ACR2NU_09720 [Aeoliella sp.]
MNESTTSPNVLGERATAEDEREFHSYRNNRIPWFVHLMWVGFFVFAICYVIAFLIPELPAEFVHSP